MTSARMTFTRRAVLTGGGTVALLLIAAMGAFACTNLATLNLATSHTSAGADVDVTGSSFAQVDEETQPVQLRWNATDGPMLAEVEPDASGGFTTTVTVPADAEPGHYVIVATQMAGEPGHGLEAGETDLAPVFGTPARAALVVGSPSAPASIDADPAPAGVPTGSGSGLLAASGLLALLALGLFGTGLGLFVRELRGRRAEPVTSPVGEPHAG